MSNTAVFFVHGFEEVEAVTVVDLLRRAKIGVETISCEGETSVRGAHDISIQADAVFAEMGKSYDGYILPGGPGVPRFLDKAPLLDLIEREYNAGKLIAAICAAPTVLEKIGVLEDKRAACFPGVEDKMQSARLVREKVAVSDNVITSRGVGTAIDFSLALVEYFAGNERAETLAREIVFK